MEVIKEIHLNQNSTKVQEQHNITSPIKGGGGSGQTPAPSPTAMSLESLTNVEIDNPTQGQNLEFDATSRKWKNKTPGNRGKIYHGVGEILTGGNNDPVRGYGDFTAICENGIAKIDFYIRTTISGLGNTQFEYGIYSHILKEIVPSLPDITPIRGGIWKSTLSIETYEHFGTLFDVDQYRWIPCRYYTQNGDQGAWPASIWTVGIPIWGTLYGTYN